MATQINKTPVQADPTSDMSWGAIFGGLVVAIAVTWLMVLLGTAIGISIADASDLEAMGEGFGFGAVIWMVLTFLIAYFLGGLVTGRLAGNPDERVGLLHGVTLWGLATVVSVWLAAAGIGGLAQAGYGAITGVMSTSVDVARGNTSTMSMVDAGVQRIIDTPQFDRIVSRVMKQARTTLAGEMAENSSALSVAEAKELIDQIDQGLLEDVGIQLLEGDVGGARDALTNQTTLSDAEVAMLVKSAQNEIRRAIPGVSTDESVVQAAGDYMRNRVSSLLTEVDQPGGAEVSREEIRTAIDQLDADTIRRVGLALVNGETERAKDILAANTTMSEAQVEAIVNGAQVEVQEQIDEVQAELTAAAETASTYATATLWALFVASALALIASIMGGTMGAGAVRKIYHA